MAYVLIALGVMLAYLDYMGSANVKAAGRIAWAELFGDAHPFYVWIGAIAIVGVIGYVDDLRPISTAFLVLILLSIILAHPDAWKQLVEGI